MTAVDEPEAGEHALLQAAAPGGCPTRDPDRGAQQDGTDVDERAGHRCGRMAGWVGTDGRGRRPHRLARLDGRACAPPTTALAGALRRAGAEVRIAAARAPRELRTFALTDLGWARAARVAAQRRRSPQHAPRAIVYSTTTAALLWPRPGAIRFDALAAANRPGRHGVWQRPLERRRLHEATLLVPWDAGSLAGAPRAARRRRVVVPVAVEPSPATRRAARHRGDHLRRQPAEEGPGPRARRLGAGAPRRRAARRRRRRPAPRRARRARRRRLAPAEYRALLRRARVFVTAPRREDYGIAQLEALADGCLLVTTAAPGPYAALPLARALDPRLVVDDPPASARAARARSTPTARRGYAQRAAAALAPFSPRRRRRASCATSCCRDCCAEPRRARAR